MDGHLAGAPLTRDTADQTECKRGRRRYRTRETGLIVSELATVNCIVTELSARGARVRLAAPTPIPEQVILKLGDDVALPARRRWARGTQVGFEFTGTEPVAFRAGEDAETTLARLAATLSPYTADEMDDPAEAVANDPGPASLAAPIRAGRAPPERRPPELGLPGLAGAPPRLFPDRRAVAARPARDGDAGPQGPTNGGA